MKKMSAGNRIEKQNSSNSSAKNKHYPEKLSNMKLSLKQSKLETHFVINEFWDKKILDLFQVQFKTIYQKSSELTSLVQMKNVLLETNELVDYFLDIFSDQEILKPILGHFYLKRCATARMIVDRIALKLHKNPDSIKKYIYSVLYNLEEIKLLQVEELKSYSKNKRMRKVQLFKTDFYEQSDFDNVLNWYKRKGEFIGFITDNEQGERERESNKKKKTIQELKKCHYCQASYNISVGPMGEKGIDCDICKEYFCAQCSFRHQC